MANERIKKDFVNGVYEIFHTLFNDGVNDGVNLHLMSENSKPNIYGECKSKIYKKPTLLVAKAVISPNHGEETVLGFTDKATFTIPLKSFQEHDLGVTKEDLLDFMKGIIEFQGVFYTIEQIVPKAYIEDIFLMYDFICKEIKDYETIEIEDIEEEYYVDSLSLVLKGDKQSLSVSDDVLVIGFSNCSVKNRTCYFGECVIEDTIEVKEDTAILDGNLSIDGKTLIIDFSNCVIGNETCYFDVTNFVDKETAFINDEDVINTTLLTNGVVRNKTLIL